MKKILIKCLVLILVFAGGLTGTIFLRDQEFTDSRGNYEHASLPEVMVQLGDVTINRMCGYSQKMQVNYMRDSLTPIGTGKTLQFLIQPNESEIKGFSYEVRTSDGNKILENKKIKTLEEVENGYKAEIKIESSILVNQEYSLQLTVDTKKGSYYYYTRIVQRSNVNEEDYAKFALDFSEKSRDKQLAETLADYLETEKSDSTTNYYKVDLHSPWEELSWGNLQPTVTQKGIPTIKDINETTGSVLLNYEVSCVNGDGQEELYQVEEFYRMRYTETGMILLDFERSLNQVFDGQLPVLTEKGLLLGVRDKNVNYMANEQGTQVVFVQQGDLWAYKPEAGKLTCIFSFREGRDSDDRDSQTEHDFKIIRVEDNGDIDFVLYGYMNRGIHEGYAGISVFHYNAEQNVVEEKLFIPSTEPFVFMEKNLGMLSYVNERNQLFVLFADKLYKVNISQYNYEVLEDGIDEEDFAVSSSNAHASWIVRDEQGATKLKNIDFDTCDITENEAGANQRFELLGYFNEDVVYGVADTANILPGIRGKEVVGLSKIMIQEFSGEIKKQYEPGYLITKVEMGNSLLDMELSENVGGKFTFIKKDSIMNSAKISAGYVSIELVYYERRGNLVRMALDTDMADETALVLKAKIDLTGQDEVILDKVIPKRECYYVYAKGHLVDTYYDPAEAIQKADELTGVVLNSRQQYVWERGNKRSSIQLTLENIPPVFLEGSLDGQMLQEALGESGTIMNLTGCTLDSVLYSVSLQRPVIVKISDTETRIIVGYDEYNTWLYNPATKETYAFAMDDSVELFEKYGNVYLTYMDNL